ncbi:protein MANNAN SYNTHESIS-RELATED 1-like [Typha angustifolia]|uniref:protein MANNAN SYNTHESIS-RELATED 1-like n=1 Tax=Typha angustifolia TaxID=59011 RepID=UPI003C2EFEF7
MDLRQVFAGFLTVSMFLMLGNMIKKDHFDAIQVMTITGSSGSQLDVIKVEKQTITKVSKVSTTPSKETNQEIRPCWTPPFSKDVKQSKGFITFSLTSGPEYHISQVTDAVVIARYLSAALVIPDIRGNKLGQKRNFQDVYDVEKFVRSLDGVIKIVRELPADLAAGKPAVVRVPNRVSEDFIIKSIEPIFRRNSYLRLAITFPSISLKLREQRNKDLVSTACLAMFGSLELKSEFGEVAEWMVVRLKALARKSDSQFIAVDLRVDDLEKNCKLRGGTRAKHCYNAQEIADFLKKVGFGEDDTIYLTQARWHESLNPLKEAFPKTYTKDDILPAEKKGEFMKSGNAQLERALDIHICSVSDVFVPTISSLFYGNVAGKRIASGRTQILVPPQVLGSSSAPSDFISPHVSKKNHVAYSCYC